MAQGDNLGAKFTLDITNLKAGLADANKLIRQTESEFIEAAAGVGDWSKSADGLTARLNTLNKEVEIQKQKMQALIAVRNETVQKMRDEGAAEEDIAAVADRVNAQLAKEQKTLETLQAKTDKAEKELNDFNNSEINAGKGADTLSKETDKAGKSAKKAGDGFTVFKGVLANLTSSIIKGFGKAITKGLSDVSSGVKKTVADVVAGSDSIAKNAEKMGFRSKTAFQEWDYVMKRTGTTTDSLKKGFVTISSSMNELTKKTKKGGKGISASAQELKTLGICAKDSNGKMRATEDVFADVVNKLSKVKNESTKTALAQKIFGKSFTELRPLLNEGAQSVESLRKRAHELGLVMSDEMLTNAENMKDSADDFNDSITGMKNKIVGDFLPSMKGVTDGLTDIFSGKTDDGLKKISEGVGSIASKLAERAPDFIKTAGVIVKSLLQAFKDNLPAISESLGGLISDILPIATQLLISAVPVLASAVGQMVGQLGAQLPQILTSLFDAFSVIITDFVAWINNGDNLEKFIDGIVSLVANTVSNLGPILEILIPATAQIITGIITALTKPENVEMLLQAAVSLAKGIFNGLVQTVPVLIDFVKNLIKNLAGLFADFLGKAVPWVADRIGDIVAKVGEIFGKLKELPAQVLEIGKNIVQGLWNGISNMTKWIAEKIKGFGKGILDGLKSFFKIKSPSRLMRDQIGRNLALGIVDGFDETMSESARSMSNAVNSAIPSVSAGLNGSAPESANGNNRGGVVVYQTNNYSQQHSRFEIYQSKRATAAAVRAALAGG
mgnify:FL=1